jgi:hypothetical protein
LILFFSGPTQTLWLDTLKNYNLTVENGALYESPHALGDIAVFWKNQSLAAPGMCLDCLIAPRPGDAESLQPILDAAAAAPPGEFKTGLLELTKLMQKLGNISATIDPAKPWLAPNAKELDNITFEEWVRNNTDSELAIELSLLAVSTQGATNTEASGRLCFTLPSNWRLLLSQKPLRNGLSKVLWDKFLLCWSKILNPLVVK